MRALIEHLANIATSGARTTLVIGAGSGADLPALRRLSNTHLVLAEANPRQARELERHIDAKRGEEVWALAITAQSVAEATLHLVNNPRHSSLKPVQGLERYFPNLHPAGELKVPARSIAEALERLQPDPDGNHVLILDAPGQTADLLGLLSPEQAQAFAWIAVRTSSTPLYQGDCSSKEVLALLERAGFEVHTEDPEAIHPYGSVLARRDTYRVEIGRLRTQLRELEHSYSEQSQRLVDQVAHLEIMTKERNEQIRLVGQYRIEAEHAAKLAAQEQKRAAERESEATRLAQERDQLAARLAEVANDTKRTALQEAAMKAELEKAQQTTSLSVKLQMLREGDLKDLQDRYGILLEKYEKQHKLLIRLSERLSVAADYYHQLALVDTPATMPNSGSEAQRIANQSEVR